jgi:hypothetical protein
MNQTKLSWLLKCADRLRDNEGHAVDVAGLLAALNIEYRTVAGLNGHGELRVGGDGAFSIVIKTAAGKLLWDRQERFTAAHELAHVLLLRKWNYRPQRSDPREYFACERMCNRFAGRLLVSPAAVERIDYHSPQACLSGVRELATKCLVSLEVAAKELALTRPGVAICFVATSERLIVWGVSSIGTFKETRDRSVVELREDINRRELASDASRACALWLSKSLQNPSLYGSVRAATISLRRGVELVSLIEKGTLAVSEQQA